MCGILGQFGTDRIDQKQLNKQLNLLKHRGPNNQDFYISRNHQLFLGHTRLSILDLSDSGNQPMISNSGRYILSFNGEIYNFKELKSKISLSIKSIKFSGTSDTEILLTCIDILGVKKTLSLIRGMFAIAVFDIQENKIFLIRDRVGEKPLYYRISDGNLFFASELKCFSHLKDLKIDFESLNLFIAQGNIPAPMSIFKGIKKLMPGHYLEFSNSNNFEVSKYWKIDINQSISKNTFDENFNIFESMFLNAVDEQMASDVPLGAFLSGGLDSSSVVAAMQELSPKKVMTHTIAYNNSSYDESVVAKKIASHLQTEHYEYLFDGKEALEVIPKIPQIYCEPFSDSSQIPTLLISRYTKSNVTVSLSGDGGDELFGGYNRYIFFNQFQNNLLLSSSATRKTIYTILRAFQKYPSLKSFMERNLKFFFGVKGANEKLEKIIKTLEYDNYEDLYFSLLQQFSFDSWPLKDQYSFNPRGIYDNFLTQEVNHFSDMRLMDFKNYLPNDILTKLDRASMSVSLEARVPFLDQRLVEFAFSLPANHLLAGNLGKLMIRKFLEKRVPSEILSLPKSGFGVPIEEWLRGDLKEFAYDHLFNSSCFNEIFDNQNLRNIWDDHQQKKSLGHHKIWSILMLKLWLSEHKNIISI